MEFAEDKDFFLRLRLYAKGIKKIPTNLTFFRRGDHERLTQPKSNSGQNNYLLIRRLYGDLLFLELAFKYLHSTKKWTRIEARFIAKKVKVLIKGFLRVMKINLLFRALKLLLKTYI